MAHDETKKRLKHVKSSPSGFTLVEILVVLSLLTATATAVMTSFMQGLKVFNRFNGSQDELEKTFLLEQMTHDLKNGAHYSLVPWHIAKDSLSFASVPSVSENSSTGFDALPASIQYRFDPEKKEVTRTINFFPFQPSSAETQVLAEGVRSMTFGVLREDDQKAPSRVSVSLEYGDESKPRLLIKEMTVPVGYTEAETL